MKRLFALLMVTLISSIGIATLAYPAGSKLVEGDVLKIEGEYYTVHDMAGHEVRVHVDKTTRLEGTFKTGDKVETHVTDKGHARSIVHITAAGKMEGAPGSKIIEGDILKIEGEYYTVHDTSGHEVPLHVDKTTHLEGAFKAGDKVEAYVTGTGHVRFLYHIIHMQPAK